MSVKAIGALVLAAILGGVLSVAVTAVAGDDEEGSVVPAAECPDALALLEDAGWKVDTFSPDCPPVEDVKAAIDERKAGEDNLDALNEALLTQLRAARDRAATDELQADVDPELALRTLDAQIAHHEGKALTEEQRELFLNGTVQRVLDALYESGEVTDVDRAVTP